MPTQNQIAYWKFKEDQRHNMAQEGQNKAELDELRRSNLVKENETARHNLAYEVETNRSNLARETETNRSNLRSEEQARINALNTMTYNQGQLAQRYREYEVDRDKLDETNRHNTVNETIEQYRIRAIDLPTAAARIKEAYANIDTKEVEALLKSMQSDWYTTDKIIEYLERGQAFANNLVKPMTDLLGSVIPFNTTTNVK